MPTTGNDLHGNAPDNCAVALLLIDVINDLEFDEGDKLLEHARPMAEQLSQLCQRARNAGIPVIYVNDNFGRWRSDFHAQVQHCLEGAVRGEPIVKQLQPHPEDYFVLKPKHSAFYSTALDLLLSHLGASTLVLTGIATNICVLFTANDAYVRDFRVFVPEDCSAANREADHLAALHQMRKILKADTRPASEIDWADLQRGNSGRRAVLE